jgi:hypothetical protein
VYHVQGDCAGKHGMSAHSPHPHAAHRPLTAPRTAHAAHRAQGDFANKPSGGSFVTPFRNLDTPAEAKKLRPSPRQ